MKNFFYVPRLLVPGKERRDWCVLSGDRYQNERSYWENEAASRGAHPSALNFIIPEVFLGDGDEERLLRIREEQYAALELNLIEKLTRGLVLTERRRKASVRRGIVAAIDLECYGAGREAGQLRSAQCAREELIGSYLAQRAVSPIETPHVVVLYNDPRGRVMRLILREDNEELYSYPVRDGALSGYFLAEDLAEAVTQELTVQSDGFFVVEGVAAAEAAKRHWEKVKRGLTKGEMGRHPARFLLAEFMNLSDDAVDLKAVHRLVKETDAEAFCDYFAKKVKCERRGRVLYPKLAFGEKNVARIDGIIGEFLKADGGRRVFVHEKELLIKYASEEDAAGVVLPEPAKNALWQALDEGEYLPEKSVCIGGEGGARYYLEAREISYD